MRLPRTTAVIAASVLLPLTAVVGSLSTSPAAASTPHRLQIVVTNDDGYRAPGIAAISSALAALPNVHVTVVAPAKDQSGTGSSTTKGKLKVTKGKTLNGLPAYAVHGYPADTIRAALDQLNLHPDLVVSGSNAGQNLGPAADLSGTIGAARAAVARGIPALAVSSGLGDPIRFQAAVPFVLRWVKDNRAALLAHRDKVHVLSFNVPSCSKGKVRGMVRVKPDLNQGDLGQALEPSHCTSKAPPGKTDVKAFGRGFATRSVLPAKPASTS
jgi:5'-nucleotidase